MSIRLCAQPLTTRVLQTLFFMIFASTFAVDCVIGLGRPNYRIASKYLESSKHLPMGDKTEAWHGIYQCNVMDRGRLSL